LAYHRRSPKGDSLVLLPLGGEEQVLTSPHLPAQAAPSDWSADGAWILTVQGAPIAIWRLPNATAPKAETQGYVLASSPEYNLFEPRFSPDERWICFLAVQRKDTAVRTIHVMPAAGGEWLPITEGKYLDDKPRWSPDGKLLYFMSNRTGFFNLWAIRFDPEQGKSVGQPFLVKAFESPEQRFLRSAGQLQLAISEQRFVLPLSQVSGNIWVLENVDR